MKLKLVEWIKIIKIIKIIKVKPKIVLLGDIKDWSSKDKYCKLMKKLGYNNYYYQQLSATDYYTPQTREKLSIVSIKDNIEKEFKFPEDIQLRMYLSDILEKEMKESNNKIFSIIYV